MAKDFTLEVTAELPLDVDRHRVVCLEWSQVDSERECAWIHPDQM
jgi:hypothetical protein